MATFKTGLEHYVKGYIRTHGLGTLPRIQIQKALVLVNTKLNDPCCTNSDAIIDLLTSKFHVFTYTVETLLSLIPKNGNVHSLQRTKAILEKRLNCCPIV